MDSESIKTVIELLRDAPWIIVAFISLSMTAGALRIIYLLIKLLLKKGRI